MNKDTRLRLEGAQWALDHVKEDGLEKTVKEFDRRGTWLIPLRISNAEEQAFIKRVNHNVIDTVLVMSLITLHDEFGFEKEELDRFKQRFNLKSESMADDPDVKWHDIIDVLKEECDIDLDDIRWANGVDPSEGR